MRKLLLITTAIIGFSTAPANAGPVVSAVSFLFGGGGFGAITSIFGFQAGTLGFTLASAALRLGASALLSRAAQAFGPKPRQADLVRELGQPNSLPPWRFVYGECRAVGSPAPLRVKGAFIYGCWILNSRPSAGPFIVLLDKRPTTVTGDPYDFAGPGAEVTNAPFAGFATYWIGRGDQVGPPAEILAEAPEFFEATDGWRGLTVIWMRLDAGPNATRAERWPATPPEVTVDGRWSLVHDPRDPGQNADDPATWEWSDNQALCTLDALRMNPLRRYALRNLWLDTFAWAADVADEPVAVKAGGTIPRYRVNGTLVFSGGAEIEDQVYPLADAGAARFIRAGGRLGLLPGAWREPVMVLDDVLDDQPFSFTRYRPSGDLATAVSATYVEPARAYEDATTPVYTLPGAQAEDGGEEKLVTYDLRFITDHRQAQRVAAIMGRRTRMQRTVSGAFPPRSLDLVPGSVATLSLPAPYAGRNGAYEVEDTQPGLDPLGQRGVALRCALTLRETSPDVYAWNAATDERDLVIEDFDPDIAPVQPPGAVTGISGADTVLVNGGTYITRIRFECDPSPSASVVSYEWQYRVDGGIWQSGGLIDADIADAEGDVFGYLVPVVNGTSYRVQVRAVSPLGPSAWVESAAITASAGTFLAPAPSPVSATGGAGQITVVFTAPNDPDYRAMEIWVATVDDAGAASLLVGPVFGAANSTLTHVHTGLGAAVTRFYFARSIDLNGNASPFSASVSATTT